MSTFSAAVVTAQERAHDGRASEVAGLRVPRAQRVNWERATRKPMALARYSGG